MKRKFLFLILFSTLFLNSCQQKEVVNTPKPIERKKPKLLKYEWVNTKNWLELNGLEINKIEIASAVNRMDKANLIKQDSIIIPSDFSGDVMYYLPFPEQVVSLKDISKILLFSYATQTFAAYENGNLAYTGPTNMGRAKDKTPTGLFFTNWKAEQTTSTFNDEWELKWNFNIENKLGIGFHQYELPGYPASHSCLRLLEKDAKFLYEWANQWVLEDKENVKVKGTPVVVFGEYNFTSPKPWTQLIQNPKILDITESEIENQIAPFLNEILKQQTKSEENSLKE